MNVYLETFDEHRNKRYQAPPAELKNEAEDLIMVSQNHFRVRQGLSAAGNEAVFLLEGNTDFSRLVEGAKKLIAAYPRDSGWTSARIYENFVRVITSKENKKAPYAVSDVLRAMVEIIESSTVSPGMKSHWIANVTYYKDPKAPPLAATAASTPMLLGVREDHTPAIEIKVPPLGTFWPPTRFEREQAQRCYPIVVPEVKQVGWEATPAISAAPAASGGWEEKMKAEHAARQEAYLRKQKREAVAREERKKLEADIKERHAEIDAERDFEKAKAHDAQQEWYSACKARGLDPAQIAKTASNMGAERMIHHLLGSAPTEQTALLAYHCCREVQQAGQRGSDFKLTFFEAKKLFDFIDDTFLSKPFKLNWKFMLNAFTDQTWNVEIKRRRAFLVETELLSEESGMRDYDDLMSAHNPFADYSQSRGAQSAVRTKTDYLKNSFSL